MRLNEYFDKAKGFGALATSDESGRVDLAVYSRPHFTDEKDDTALAFIIAEHQRRNVLRGTWYRARIVR